MFEIVHMTIADLDDVLHLQQTVYDDLTETEKSFILPKTREHLTDIFNRGSFMIGIRRDGHLVAQSVVLNPTTAYPDTGMVDMADVGAPETISVLQGVLVHPKSRGHSLGKMMCLAWLSACRQNGRHNVIAETALPNIHSQSIFFAHHIPIVSIGIDPTDGAIVCNHHADLKSAVKPFACASGYTMPLTNAPLIRKVLAEGYVAASHHKFNDEHHLVLTKAPI